MNDTTTQTSDLHEGPHGPRLRLVLEAVEEARNVLLITGNALSRESGVMMPAKADDLHTRRCVSIDGFREDPESAWRWWNGRIEEIHHASPAEGHASLGSAFGKLKKLTISTQCVDGLHQRAGFKNVNELHGNLRSARCERCGSKMPVDGPLAMNAIEHECGGVFRPDVLLEGEKMSAHAFGMALMAAQQADVIISVGVDHMSMPMASLLEPRWGKPFVVDVNMRPNFGTSPAMVTIPCQPSAFLSVMIEHLKNQQQKEANKFSKDVRSVTRSIV